MRIVETCQVKDANRKQEVGTLLMRVNDLEVRREKLVHPIRRRFNPIDSGSGVTKFMPYHGIETPEKCRLPFLARISNFLHEQRICILGFRRNAEMSIVPVRRDQREVGRSKRYVRHPVRSTLLHLPPLLGVEYRGRKREIDAQLSTAEIPLARKGILD